MPENQQNFTLKYGTGKEATAEGRDELRQKRAGQNAIPSLDDVLADYPEFAPSTCIFVSGSLTQGWGHAKSDLDLYVISEEPLDLSNPQLELYEQTVSTDPAGMHVAIAELGHYRADIELWLVSQVEQLIGRFDAAVPSQEAAALGHGEKDLFYRLVAGAPLSGDAWWSSARERILASSYGLWLAENRKLMAEGQLEDVSGLLESGDEHSAALAAREGLVLGLEAALALGGDYSPSRKWLHRRTEVAKNLPVATDVVWSALTMQGATEEPGRWASRTAGLIQQLILPVEEAAL
ncbi:hypothetical protein ACFQ8C_06905 [Streptomyces sp. NPDC056503]|uniref:hypothetical protein n=1 Tax=Streptomyces sp. NPDC056503 TaxID=3345842 RepID=UPI0036CA53EF